MDVFISWSGELSYKIAKILHQFLTDVIQSLQPFVSADDIAKGTVWPTELFDKLETTQIGIVCLTRENKDKPWVLFEAGAIAKAIHKKAKVCTLLIDLNNADIRPPLSLFQSTTLIDKTDMLRLINSLNSSGGQQLLPEEKLKRAFDTFWDDFLIDIQKIIESSPKQDTIDKNERDQVVDEILLTVRNTASLLGTVFPEKAFFKEPVNPQKTIEFEIIYPPDIEKRPVKPHRRTLQVYQDDIEIGILSTKPYSPPVWIETTDEATPLIASLVNRILPTGGIGAITPERKRITWKDTNPISDDQGD